MQIILSSNFLITELSVFCMRVQNFVYLKFNSTKKIEKYWNKHWSRHIKSLKYVSILKLKFSCEYQQFSFTSKLAKNFHVQHEQNRDMVATKLL